MTLEGKIRPINNANSIKEAVISVFLVNPIIKPERFRELIEKEFVNKFHQFELVSQVQIQVKGTKGVIETPEHKILDNVGFRFMSFEKGLRQKVLQAMNESSRNFISYHSLNYNNWSSFYNDYIECITTILEYQSDMYTPAFSLHYIDEFEWIESQTPIALELILEKNTDYLPSDFFRSINTDYVISTEKYENGNKFLDRLELKIDSKINPRITISHSITNVLDDVTELKGLINTADFSNRLSWAHNLNKKLLNSILKDEVKKMIKI